MQNDKATVEQDVAELCAIYADPMRQIFPAMSSTERKLMRVVIALACGDAIDVSEVERTLKAKADLVQARDNAAV